ncbi:MAG: right-handed parallel beta-helix repeat-containing protein [Candidatus Heimdallarchaeaceae archaeon]
MKERSSLFKKEAIALLIFILIGVGLPLFLSYEKTYYIEITSDKELKRQADSGEGTILNPYIITDRYIVGEGHIGISIKNTKSYFVVKDCFLSGNFFYGIYLENIAEGTAFIENITATFHSIAGIGIYSSNNVRIVDSFVYQNDVGIQLTNSSSSILENNFVVATVAAGPNSPLYEGIVIENSDNVEIISNKVEKIARAIMIEDSNNCSISSNIIKQITHIGYSFTSSSDCLLLNNTSSKDSMYSFRFTESHSNIIENNSIIDSDKGIYLTESNNNRIRFNLIQQNTIGIQAIDSSSNNITRNSFVNNTEEGVYLSGSSSFLIHHNDFFFNNLAGTSQARDNGQENYWFDVVNLEGNYWNDYNDTGYYQISGSANSKDLYPLGDDLSYSIKNRINRSILQPIQNLKLQRIVVSLIS